MNYIVYTTLNHNYSKLGAALISSIWENGNSNVIIRILDTGLTERDKHQFINWAKRKNRIIEIINVSIDMFLKYIDLTQEFYTQISYYARMLIPHIAGYNESRILYLDADILCISDFTEIYTIDLNDKIMGCCKDRNFPMFSSRISDKSKFMVINNFKDLGFSGHESYFNSGVLLIDRKKWLDLNLSEKILSISLRNKSSVFLWDQYAMNIVLAGKWVELERKWNETNLIIEDETKFRHFIKKKPTEYNYNYGDREQFFRFLDNSPWKGWRPSRFYFFYSKLVRYLNKKQKHFKKS